MPRHIFFGKELFKKLDVPIGLIHTSWGGTPVESWINKSNLLKYNEFNDVLNKIEISEDQNY